MLQINNKKHLKSENDCKRRVNNLCLGIPGKIIAVSDDGTQAILNTMGLISTVGLELLAGAVPGDYVIVHAGHAIQKVDMSEAEERLKLWEEIVKVGDTAAFW